MIWRKSLSSFSIMGRISFKRYTTTTAVNHLYRVNATATPLGSPGKLVFGLITDTPPLPRVEPS
jgi:hypothetical protein